MNITKKVTQNSDIGEKAYRKLRGRLSASDLRTFMKSRKKFYKSCILGEYTEKEESVSMTLGDIADCILTCPELMDEKFIISTAGVPVGQLLELCDALYKRTLKSMDSEGKQTEEFTVIFQETLQYLQQGKDPKFKGKPLEKVIELFTTPDKNGVVAEYYYKERLQSVGKQVISISMMEAGERYAKELRESPYTGEIINAVSTENIEIHNQLIVLFEYKGIEMRSMIDKVRVNHITKVIEPFDVKTTYDNEGFDKMYLKGLYIPAAVYNEALNQWKVQQGIGDYIVMPLQYPVADTMNENAPLLYKLTGEDIVKAYEGFQLEGSSRKWLGLISLMDDIKFHIETGNWSISRSAYEAKGVLSIGLNYMNIPYENQ